MGQSGILRMIRQRACSSCTKSGSIRLIDTLQRPKKNTMLISNSFFFNLSIKLLFIGYTDNFIAQGMLGQRTCWHGRLGVPCVLYVLYVLCVCGVNQFKASKEPYTISWDIP